ncbi:MAG: SPOR domain-containing protein, partial [Gammaproteobacteria bacterium]|nr:SPOR domain-containing protein [Gammaproteobacteria bacterium]
GYRETDTRPEPANDDKTEVAKADATSGTSAATDSPSSQASQSEQASSGGTHYVLQAGSYRREADAERLRARLALLGLGSYIQKVTIQDRGDFYRVRLGPFSDYEDMVKADGTLGGEGIKPLRLKVSKSN